MPIPLIGNTKPPTSVSVNGKTKSNNNGLKKAENGLSFNQKTKQRAVSQQPSTSQKGATSTQKLPSKSQKKKSNKPLPNYEKILKLKQQESATKRHRFITPRTFLIVTSLVLVFRHSLTYYTSDVGDALRLEYSFDASQVSFLASMEATGFTVVSPLVFHFGHRAHKPRALFAGSLVCILGAVLSAVPRFALGSNPLANLTNVVAYYETGLCQIQAIGNSSDDEEIAKSQCEIIYGSNSNYVQQTAIYVLAVGQFVFGVGTAFLAFLPLVFLREIVGDEKELAIFLGVLLSTNGLGRVLGSSLASGLPIDLEDLQEYPDLAGGGWWTGLIALGACLLLSSPFLLVFPRWFTIPTWVIQEAEQMRAHAKRLLKLKQRRKLAQIQGRSEATSRRSSYRSRMSGSSGNQSKSSKGTPASSLPSDESKKASKARNRKRLKPIKEAKNEVGRDQSSNGSRGKKTVEKERISSSHQDEASGIIDANSINLNIADSFQKLTEVQQPSNRVQAASDRCDIQVECDVHSADALGTNTAPPNPDPNPDSDLSREDQIATGIVNEGAELDEDSNKTSCNLPDLLNNNVGSSKIDRNKTISNDFGNDCTGVISSDPLEADQELKEQDGVSVRSKVPRKRNAGSRKVSSIDAISVSALSSVSWIRRSTTRKVEDSYTEIFREGLKDILHNCWEFLRQFDFTICVCASALASYWTTGFISTLPPYLENQFRVTGTTARVSTGIISGLLQVTGILVGSVVLFKTRMSVPRQFQCVTMAIGVALLCTIIFFGFGCPQLLHSVSNTLGPDCPLGRCSCSTLQLYPVCNEDASQIFLSPCLAGCSELDFTVDRNLPIYSNCLCLNESSTSTAEISG